MLIILRGLAVVALLLVFAGVAGYFISGERRYLRFSWRVFIVTLALALLMFALLLIERLAIIPLPA